MDRAVRDPSWLQLFECSQEADGRPFSSNNASQPQSTQASPGQGGAPVLPPPPGWYILFEDSGSFTNVLL